MMTQELLQRACSYLVEHPEELARIVRNAVELRFGIPLAALRWAASQAAGRRAPTDVVIEAAPPGIRVAGTVAVMGSKVRASALIFVDDIRVTPDELRVELRLAEVSLVLIEGDESPLAALVNSGALDLSKLGNLVGAFPRKPAFLLEAHDDRIVLDLKRHPALQGARAERLLALITPLVTITAVKTAAEHLDVELGVLREGLGAAVASWRNLL